MVNLAFAYIEGDASEQCQLLMGFELGWVRFATTWVEIPKFKQFVLKVIFNLERMQDQKNEIELTFEQCFKSLKLLPKILIY